MKTRFSRAKLICDSTCVAAYPDDQHTMSDAPVYPQLTPRQTHFSKVLNLLLISNDALFGGHGQRYGWVTVCVYPTVEGTAFSASRELSPFKAAVRRRGTRPNCKHTVLGLRSACFIKHSPSSDRIVCTKIRPFFLIDRFFFFNWYPAVNVERPGFVCQWRVFLAAVSTWPIVQQINSGRKVTHLLVVPVSGPIFPSFVLCIPG